MPVAAIDAPGQYDFWTPGVWGAVQDRMLDAIGGLGGIRSHDAGVRDGRQRRAPVDRLRRQLLPFAGKKLDAAGAYPKSDDSFPTQLSGLAAMIAAGLPLHCVALEASGSYDTHADQTTDARAGARDHRRLAARLPARPRVARHRRPRADARLERVRPPSAGERSGGTDHGAAGCGFLIGTHAAGTQVGEFPGLGALDRDGNLKPTSDFRSVYSALLEQWLHTDAERVIPGSKKFQRPVLVK